MFSIPAGSNHEPSPYFTPSIVLETIADFQPWGIWRLVRLLLHSALFSEAIHKTSQPTFVMIALNNRSFAQTHSQRSPSIVK